MKLMPLTCRYIQKNISQDGRHWVCVYAVGEKRGDEFSVYAHVGQHRLPARGYEVHVYSVQRAGGLFSMRRCDLRDRIQRAVHHWLHDNKINVVKHSRYSAGVLAQVGTEPVEP